MLVSTAKHEITWQKLPPHYKLPDDPVDNINQPTLAAALSEILVENGLLPENALTCTNYGICATFNGKIVVKAPDWAYIPQITVPRDEVIRSYTPFLDGSNLAIAIEFLSDTEGGEYSIKATYPPGKWFFYEQILKVPNYVIFDPSLGEIEVYRLNGEQNYVIQSPSEDRLFWIEEMKLYLGVWHGSRQNRNSYWLRWWNADKQLLLWGIELTQKLQEAEQKVSEAEQKVSEAEQKAKIEEQRANRLLEKLKELGVNPDE